MAPSKCRRKPPDFCASLSLPLEKHRGEHPGNPALLQSSPLISSLSHSKVNPTLNRAAPLFPSSPSAWHGGCEAGMEDKDFPRKCHWDHVAQHPPHTFACGHRNRSRRRRCHRARGRRWPFASGCHGTVRAQPWPWSKRDGEGNLHPVPGGSQGTAAGGVLSELCLATRPCCPRVSLAFCTSPPAGGRHFLLGLVKKHFRSTHTTKTRSGNSSSYVPASQAGKFLLSSKAAIAGAELFLFGQHIQANTWQEPWLSRSVMAKSPPLPLEV